MNFPSLVFFFFFTKPEFEVGNGRLPEIMAEDAVGKQELKLDEVTNERLGN